MNTGRISVRYAKALLNTAIEQKIADKINDDIKILFNTCDISEFRILLENPVVIPSRKSKIFNDLFKDALNPLTVSFFDLLVKNKREHFLKSICRSFLALYRKTHGITSVNFITAEKADKETINKINSILAESLSKKIELNNEIKPEIIGGFILQIEDLQYDAGVSSKLTKIKRELTEK